MVFDDIEEAYFKEKSITTYEYLDLMLKLDIYFELKKLVEFSG